MRLDAELVRRGLARSRELAVALVRNDGVRVDGSPARKPAQPVSTDTRIEVSPDVDSHVVSRGAHKLRGALDALPGLDPRGRRCLDAGASTGGFTQVLLDRGAAHVVAVDVGHGQLASTITDDDRVTSFEGLNLRDLQIDRIGGPADLVVADLSFISLRLTLPSMADRLRPDGDLVALVKPQFEVGRDRVGRSGVVTSRVEHARVLRDLTRQALALDLGVLDLVPSPIRGADGNREYLLWMTPRPGEGLDPGAVEALIEQVKGRP